MAELKGLKRKREDGEQNDSLAEVPASRPVLPDNVTDSCVSCEIALRGLNVKSNFADLLVSGVKDIECRKYILGARGTGRTTFVIRTKGADKRAVPAVIGMVRFEGCYAYASKEQYEADRSRHHIVSSSEFEWSGASELYAWQVGKCFVFQEPIPVDKPNVPRRNMIGWTKPVKLKVKVLQSQLDAILEMLKDD